MVKKPFLIVLMALVLLGSGCTPPQPFDSWRGKLEVKGTPSLNSEVEIVFTLDPLVDIPSTRMRVWLPDGVELVSGNRIWQGDARRGEVLTFSLRLRVLSNGQQQVAILTFDRFQNFYVHTLYFVTVGKYGFIRESPIWPFPYKKALFPQ